jgi:hypothetical protein
MKEEFERFWQYKSSYWAGRFLHVWCVRAMRSKIEPMKKFVGTIRNHRDLLLNWFKSKGLSSGTRNFYFAVLLNPALLSVKDRI